MGAQALFGEKYGQIVRVVTMGDKFSIEFCGGTHVDNVAKIGPFRISSEFSVASGVRRIEAVTGLEFFRQNEEMNRRLMDMANVLKASPFEVVEKARHAMAELREMHRKVETLQAKLRTGEVNDFLTSARNIDGVHVVTITRNGLTTDDLRRMGDYMRDKDPNIAAVLASVDGEKITFQAVCGKEAVARGIKAGDIIKQVTAMCGGKGGGRPDSAMGGGKDVVCWTTLWQ